MKRIFLTCLLAGVAFAPLVLHAEDVSVSAERIKTLEAKVDALTAKVDLLLQLQHNKNTEIPVPPMPPSAPSPVVSLTAPPPPSPSEDVPLFVQKEEHIPVLETLPQSNTPEGQYKAAFQLINDGKYDEAAEKFRHFIASHSDHKLAALAHYWLGEIYFEKKELQKAHDAFMASYQSDPNSEKGPESLLKVALVLKEMSQPKQACVALEILNRDYPDSQAASRAKANADLAQLSCETASTSEPVKQPQG